MINLVVVGKLKEKAMQAISDEFEMRIQPYHKLKITELKDFTNSGSIDAIAKEAELIKKQIKDRDFVIVLDLDGKDITSPQLAEKIDDAFLNHGSNISFIIGGSMGLCPTIKARANYRWKLSSLTFTHQFARMIVLEQVYRVFKILANEPYHK